MQEFTITQEAIKNIVTILADLSFKHTAHLLVVGQNGAVGLRGVTPIMPPENIKTEKLKLIDKGKKDGDIKQ